MRRAVLPSLLLAVTAEARAPQPANDLCRDATVISALPFSAVLGTRAATREIGEFLPPSCSQSDGAAVWYRIEPELEGMACAEMSCEPDQALRGNALGVFACAAPASCIGCAQDNCTTCDRPLPVRLTRGVPLLISVGRVNPAAGGPVTFRLDTPDSDGDGFVDCLDRCPGQDDGPDRDHDGVPDCADACPDIPNGLDTDGDGIPDCFDRCPGRNDITDAERDGVPDCLDNCPFVFNPGQEDSDHDGKGDACQGDVFQLLHVLHPSAPAAGDQFGSAIAPVFDFGRPTQHPFGVLVGAPRRNVDGVVDAGAAYFYDGRTGELVSELRKALPVAGDRLGSAVASVTGAPLVGASFDDPGGVEGAGAVYIGFNDMLVLVGNPAPRPGAQLGFALAASPVETCGGLIFTLGGAPGDDGVDGGLVDAGAAYVAGAELRAVELSRPEPAAFAQFGSAVAVLPGCPERIAVGAPFDTVTVTRDGHEEEVRGAGAVYLFDAASGHFLCRIPNPDPAPDDLFGASLAEQDTNVFVGAPFDDSDGQDAGIVYHFALDKDDDLPCDQLITRLGDFHDPVPQPEGHFGTSLANFGNYLFVGAPGDGVAGVPRAGAVHVFQATPDNPALHGPVIATIPNPTPDEGDQFGFAISAAAGPPPILNSLHVGAPGDDRYGPDAGIAYFFNFCQNDCPQGCGNGIVDAGEECDDTNDVAGDGCDPNCTRTRCGNGRITDGEQCDDGNDTAGDGCSPGCVVEAGFSCTGEPSHCVNGCSGPAEAQSCCSCPVECNDGNDCTVNDRCENGLVVGDRITCDDGNACTVDSCERGRGCVHQPISCDDGAPCTTKTCDPQVGCKYTPQPGCCQQDEDCQNAETCDGTEECRHCVCAEGVNLPCCDPGSPGTRCVARNVPKAGTPCPTNDPCTVDGHCQHRRCVGRPKCDDGNQCTIDSCVLPDGSCTHATPDPKCRPCTGDEECDDGNRLTEDTCAPALGCQHQCVAQQERAGCLITEALAADSCTTPIAPSVLRSRLAQAAEWTARAAEETDAKAQGWWVRRAKGGLAKAKRAVTKAYRRRGIGRGCHDSLAASIQNAQTVLRQLARTAVRGGSRSSFYAAKRRTEDRDAADERSLAAPSPTVLAGERAGRRRTARRDAIATSHGWD